MWPVLLPLLACSGGTLRVDPDALEVCEDPTLREPPPEWVDIPGATFRMGTDPPVIADEGPAHDVTVAPFQIQRHEVTVEQFETCVRVGHCSPRPPGDGCLEGEANARFPVNCLDHDRAWQVCKWLGGRLPSESEWEWAASGGRADAEYPWGSAPPDCTRSNTNQGDGVYSCDSGGLWEVCTHPAGDTPQGVCDMGGNVIEWLYDWYRPYDVHPRDGSPQETMDYELRVMRGGGVGSDVVPRVRQRTFHDPHFGYPGSGARCVRPIKAPR
ncbi:MAG: SUMF1/EgtB/PvdO family nonheme iron enzyme [Myxococcales bacterium]|nr:SUMF1/EgtB/PvdO family nonheme iron enzyme [Myxococcales bacterium]MCB9668952.1 SUMF1/EgtB/PvdO family nonheme iron enzyme [Alphaproteobacteria bacterium]MCB9691279.1 SUMF1/EgtB/PvdO family nonheme iron enzyme [Alphaproteobacteria bacterium]